MAVIQEPAQSTLQPITESTLIEKQSPVTDLERASAPDGENPEFKLPKMSSLVVVLVTNVLLQVMSRSCKPSEPL